MTRLLVDDHRALLAALVLGGAAGATLWLNALAPVVLVLALLMLGVGLYKPDLMIPAVYISILLDQVGRFDFYLGPIPMTLAKLSVLATMGVWLVHAVAYRKALIRPTPFTPGLIAILVTMMVSTVAARSLDGERAFLFIVSVGLLAVLVHVIDAIGNPRNLQGVLRVLAVATVGLMLYTLMSGVRVEDMFFDGRQAGTLGDPNEWCALLLVTCPLFMGALAHDRHPLAPPLLALLTFLFPLLVFQSLSRAGFAAMLLLSPFLIYLLWPWRRYGWIAVVAALLYVPMVVDTELLTGRYETLLSEDSVVTDGSIAVRSVLARTAIALFLERPFLGVGLGMFPLEATLYTSGHAYMKVAHNTFLTVAAEQGLVGLLSHGFLLLVVGTVCARMLRRATTPRMRRLAAGVPISLAGVAVMALTLDLMTFTPIYVVLGLALVIRGALEEERAEALAASDGPEPLDVAEAPGAGEPGEHQVA